MSPIKNVAIINQLGQVVNHIVVDTDDTKLLDNLHAEWGTNRHVETTESDVIILDPSPEIWTTHCDNPDCEKSGFNLPEEPVVAIEPIEPIEPIEEVTINGRVYPIDSLLIKENAHLRPAGWIFPSGDVEVSLADAE